MRSTVLIILCAMLISTSIAVVEITNLICQSIDKSYADFEYCHIKAINRTYKYISVKVNLFKLPINNVSVNVAIKKKANGYKPFLYNVTADGCKFFRGRTNPLLDYFYSFIKPFTNANHTCPFNHDLLFEKIDTSFLDDQLTTLLPVPEGEYGVFTTWWTYNIPRAYVNIFWKLTNS